MHLFGIILTSFDRISRLNVFAHMAFSSMCILRIWYRQEQAVDLFKIQKLGTQPINSYCSEYGSDICTTLAALLTKRNMAALSYSGVNLLTFWVVEIVNLVICQICSHIDILAV